MTRHCINLAYDDQGPFCIVHALEGHGCCCGYTGDDCHVVTLNGKRRIQCGGEKLGIPTLVGVCQDFEPEPWLKMHLGVEPLDYSI